MFCWGQNIQLVLVFPPLDPPWHELTLRFSLIIPCPKQQKNIKTLDWQVSFTSKDFFKPSTKSHILSLSIPLWNNRNSSTVWWRLCTRLSLTSSVVSSPTSSSSLVNDALHHCTVQHCTTLLHPPKHSLSLTFSLSRRRSSDKSPPTRKTKDLRWRWCRAPVIVSLRRELIVILFLSLLLSLKQTTTKGTIE